VAIRVRCVCGQEFETPDAYAGLTAACPDCGRDLVIPKPELPPDQFVELKRVYPPWSRAAVLCFVLSLVACYGLCTLNYVALALCIPAFFLGVVDLKTSPSRPRSRGRSFAVTGTTLSGLLILIGTVLPFTSSGRKAAKLIQCSRNLEQIGLALRAYHDRHGCFPAAATFDRQGRPLLGWRVVILPHMGQGALYHKFRLDEPWYSPHNKGLLSEMPPVFSCPSRRGEGGWSGRTAYQAVVGPRAMFTGAPEGVRLQDVTDGPGLTLMVVETDDAAPWTAPHDLCFTTASGLGRCGGKHPGMFNVLFADGAVRMLSLDFDPPIFWRLITRNGGEVFSGDEFVGRGEGARDL
jgi:prepilin-type processing-associated H-X9-DG protein